MAARREGTPRGAHQRPAVSPGLRRPRLRRLVPVGRRSLVRGGRGRPAGGGAADAPPARAVDAGEERRDARAPPGHPRQPQGSGGAIGRPRRARARGGGVARPGARQCPEARLCGGRSRRHLPRRRARRHAPGGGAVRRVAREAAAARQHLLSRRVRADRPPRGTGQGGGTCRFQAETVVERMATDARTLQTDLRRFAPSGPARARVRRRAVRAGRCHVKGRPRPRTGRLRDGLLRARSTVSRQRRGADAGAADADEGAPPPGPNQHVGVGASGLLGSLQRVHRHPVRGTARLRAEDRAAWRSGDLPCRG